MFFDCFLIKYAIIISNDSSFRFFIVMIHHLDFLLVYIYYKVRLLICLEQ